MHNIGFSSECQVADAYMDQKLLRHLLTNLVFNSIKSSPQSSKVHVDLTCQEEKAVFRIQDSGNGISLSDRELLSQASSQGSNGSPLTSSSLALLIVKQCVDLRDGEISVDTQDGFGTTYTVTLPLHQQQAEV